MRALQQLQVEVAVPAAALAHHSLQAGELDTSCHYHFLAGRNAASEYAFARAVGFYTKALELAELTEQAVEPGLLRALADAAFQAGNYRLAQATYRRQLLTLDDPIDKADVLSMAAEVKYRSGESSAELHERALRTLGFDVPGSRAAVLFAVTKNAFRVLQHAVLPQPIAPRPDERNWLHSESSRARATA